MKKVMFVLGAILSIVACQKSNQPLPPDYYPLAVGNFWVYDMHRVDSVGNNLSLWKTDSTIIVSDTMIGSVQFLKRSTILSMQIVSPTVTCVHILFDTPMMSWSHPMDLLYLLLMDQEMVECIWVAIAHILLNIP